MLTIYEYGTYTTKYGQELNIYMVEHQGGTIMDVMLDDRDCAAVTYNLDVNGHTELLLWPDWLAFAHKVNSIAGEEILNIHKDPAIEQGLAVPVGMECPNCGCRVMDALIPLEEETGGDFIFCSHCEEPYQF